MAFVQVSEGRATTWCLCNVLLTSTIFKISQITIVWPIRILTRNAPESVSKHVRKLSCMVFMVSPILREGLRGQRKTPAQDRSSGLQYDCVLYHSQSVRGYVSDPWSGMRYSYSYLKPSWATISGFYFRAKGRADLITIPQALSDAQSKQLKLEELPSGVRVLYSTFNMTGVCGTSVHVWFHNIAAAVTFLIPVHPLQKSPLVRSKWI